MARHSHLRAFFLLCNILMFTEARLLLAGPVRYTVEFEGEKRPKMEEVVSILRNAGGFDFIATLFDAIDITILPSNATIFAPNDHAALPLEVLTFAQALPTLQYHVLTRQLPFNDLKNMPAGSVIETLLKNFTVQITSNNPWHFTVDNVQITNPDMFLKSGFVIHGLNGVLNSSVFGKTTAPPAPSLPLLNATSPESPPISSPQPPHLSPKNAPQPSQTKPSSNPASQSRSSTPSPAPIQSPTPAPMQSDSSFIPLPARAPTDTIPKHKHISWKMILVAVSVSVGAALLATLSLVLTNVICASPSTEGIDSSPE